MAYGNLVQLSDVKTFLGIPSGDTSEDTYLNQQITNVSYLIQNYCDRNFGAQATYTEYYSGDGTICLVLNQRPVSPVGIQVWLDDNAYWNSASGAFASDTLLTYGTDYALELDGADGLSYCGILQGISTAWDAPFLGMPGRIYPLLGTGALSWGNIKVSYLAGYYPSTPSDIQLATLLQITAIRNSKNTGQLLGNESFSDGAGSNNYSLKKEAKIGIFTAEVTSILSRYKNIPVA